jgi:hypothetical protein
MNVGTDSRRIAWLAWLAVAVAVTALALNGYRRSVVPAYRSAALAWMDGRSLYTTDGSGFLYLPQAAILYVPFAVLPERVGEALWRIVGIGVFACGTYRLARLARMRSVQDGFALASLVVLPLAWDCARNGQATLLLSGLILSAVVDFTKGRFTRSAVALSLGLAIKPLAIVPGGVLAVLDRRILWRLAVGGFLCLVSPFAFQYPGYTAWQYMVCWQSLQVSAHVGVVELWAQPFSVLQLLHVDIPESAQTSIRVAAGIAVAGMCWIAQRRLDSSRLAIFLYSITSTYLMLFNPRTENNSYAMLAPAIGVMFAEAMAANGVRREAVLLLLISAGIVGGNRIGSMLLADVKPIWLAPIMATGFAVYLLAKFGAEIRRATNMNVSPESDNAVR